MLQEILLSRRRKLAEVVEDSLFLRGDPNLHHDRQRHRRKETNYDYDNHDLDKGEAPVGSVSFHRMIQFWIQYKFMI